MAGGLKRANPDLVEDGVLIRAMRDANVPKFLKDDLPLFAGGDRCLGAPGCGYSRGDWMRGFRAER